MAVGDLIADGLRHLGPGKPVDDLELYLHLLRLDAFDVDRDGVSHRQLGEGVRQAREVGCELHKDAVVLETADDAPDRLAGTEAAGVFHPGAQQFPVAQVEAVFLRLHGGDHRQQVLSHPDPVAGMGDAGNGEGLNGQQGDDAAAHVHKGAEGLQVGDLAGDDHAWRQVAKHPVQGLGLGPATGEGQAGPSGFIRFQGGDAAAHRLSHQGQYGDLPPGAADEGVNGLLSGDAAGKAAQGDHQVVVFLTAQDRSLQDRAGFLRLLDI